MGLFDEIKKHGSETYDTLSEGLMGDRARGLLDMFAGNIKSGLPMLDKDPMDWEAADVLNVAMGGTIAGRLAKTANPDMLKRADEMKAAGYSRDEIWKTTGEEFNQPAFFDGDGNLKWEIDDSGMSFKRQNELGADLEPAKEYQKEVAQRIKDYNSANKGQADLFPSAITRAKKELKQGAKNRVSAAELDSAGGWMSDIVKHKEMSDAYPGLLENTHAWQDDMHGATGAQWRDNAGDRHIRWGVEDSYSGTNGLLAHELNHGIQDIENLPMGGSPDSNIKAFDQKTYRELAKRKADYNEHTWRSEDSRDYYAADHIASLDKIINNAHPKPSSMNRTDFFENSDRIRAELGAMPKKAGQNRDNWIQRAAILLKRKAVSRNSYAGELAKDPNKIRSELGKLTRKMKKTEVNAREYRGIMDNRHRVNDMSGFDKYQRLAGEADARAVQARMDMTMPERIDRPFPKDYDVPESEFIYNYRKGLLE